MYCDYLKQAYGTPERTEWSEKYDDAKDAYDAYRATYPRNSAASSLRKYSCHSWLEKVRAAKSSATARDPACRRQSSTTSTFTPSRPSTPVACSYLAHTAASYRDLFQYQCQPGQSRMFSGRGTANGTEWRVKCCGWTNIRAQLHGQEHKPKYWHNVWAHECTQIYRGGNPQILS